MLLRANTPEDWFEIGLKDGVHWTKNDAGYFELEEAYTFEPYIDRKGEDGVYEPDESYNPVDHEILGEYFASVFEKYSGSMEMIDDSNGNHRPNAAFAHWEDGWKYGVWSVWKQVEGLVDRYETKQTSKFLEK